MRYRTFIKIYFMILILLIILIFVIMMTVDPAFHYHAPIEGVSYILNKERYQNDGILKHFDYDTIIIGSSMAENCRKTDVDELFNADSVKTCYMGATYRELSEGIRTAISNNPGLKRVILAADMSGLIVDADKMDADFDYPTYLYDTDPFNDLKYLLNLTMLGYAIQDIKMSLTGEKSTSFDEYSSWRDPSLFGKEAVFNSFSKRAEKEPMAELTDAEKLTVENNVYQNIVKIAEDNPDITFYVWIPPYSICYFDSLDRNGQLYKYLAALKLELVQLTKANNIKAFCFLDRYDIITNLDLYRDYAHYNESINAEILQDMRDDKGRITSLSVERYMDRITDYYLNYNYDSIYE